VRNSNPSPGVREAPRRRKNSLSPRERVGVRACQSSFRRARSAAPAQELPLPLGEGRGEGEAFATEPVAHIRRVRAQPAPQKELSFSGWKADPLATPSWLEEEYSVPKMAPIAMTLTSRSRNP
jgi:hypothetical protein